MGNCGFKGFGIGIGIGSGGGAEEMMIKVVTSSGGIMELHPPITAECITNEFPGHAVFRSRDLFSQPLLHSQQLQVGELYYLLPHLTTTTNSSSMVSAAPYRMSFENKQLVRGSILKRSSEVLPRYNNSSKGVWKVKLVISPHRLSEILSHDARTEALIESVRTVAKCGTTVVGGGLLSSSSSLSNSDHCTLFTTPQHLELKEDLNFQTS